MDNLLNILIIDDDKFDRKAVVRALNQSGESISITEASTAQEGLSLSVEKQFDIILLDYNLPDCNGLTLLSELRVIRINSTAIVIFSGDEDECLALKAIEAGAQGFLAKDELNSRRLLRAIHLARHRYGLEEALNTAHTELRHLASHDSLTGLANRHTFDRELHAAVARAQRGERQLAVFVLDLDNFKQINDTFGHTVGDSVLIEVSRRLKTVVRNTDLLARLGGDEFVILAEDMQKDDQAHLLAGRIVAVFNEPIHLEAVQWQVTTSIGIANFDDTVNTQSELLKCADLAMYRAKQDGLNQFHFYSKKLHEAVRQRVAIGLDLQQALALNQFKIYYQTQVNALDGTLGGMEALVRWEHPERGLIPPDIYIPIAEESGLMVDIGKWIMRTACQQFVEWREQIIMQNWTFPIAINLSAVELHSKELVTTLETLIEDTGIDPACLELEITENALIKDPVHIGAKLTYLTASGVQIALDDFGTGYSTMQHLLLFPVHALKIDKSLVAGVGKDANTERLLVAMINFALALELIVVAEGVETFEQADFCRNHGCHLLQGYYFCEPMSADAFEAAFLTGVAEPSL